MQKLEIVFDEALDAQVLMILRQNGIDHYTKIELVKGVGNAGAKFNNPVGPGINSLLLAIVPDEKVENFVRSFRRFKEVQGEHAGAILMVSAVSEYI